MRKCVFVVCSRAVNNTADVDRDMCYCDNMNTADVDPDPCYSTDNNDVALINGPTTV